MKAADPQRRQQRSRPAAQLARVAAIGDNDEDQQSDEHRQRRQPIDFGLNAPQFERRARRARPEQASGSPISAASFLAAAMVAGRIGQPLFAHEQSDEQVEHGVGQVRAG